MTPTDLAALVRAAATDVLTGRGLGTDAVPVEIDISRPRNPAHGDYATSVALRAAKRVGVPPRELAGWLVDDLGTRAGIATAEVAGPGFVNLRLAAAARGALVGEVLAAGRRYGGDPAAVEALRGEAADLVRDDAPVRVSTPAAAGTGTTVPTTVATVGELVRAVGVDAARYAVLRSSGASPGVTVLDLAALTVHTSDNPVHHVQYAHARLCSLARNAVELRMTPGRRYELLDRPREGELIRTLGEYPDVVRTAADLREPHRVARFLETMATVYHRFDESCRVLPMGDEPITEPHRARLALASAARQVLANGLDLLGVSAPERM
ncbi:MAG: arginyl-tRNA synthetase [Pseudonocardiales bacterium]|nr:arginyl-tRNA synthetase [Pseudonocardiales bacterium]